MSTTIGFHARRVVLIGSKGANPQPHYFSRKRLSVSHNENARLGVRIRNFRFAMPLLFLVIFGATAGNGFAQELNLPDEINRRVQSSQNIATYGPELFGDSVSLSTGAMQMSITDVSIPGNSGLPLALTRRLDIQAQGDTYPSTLRVMAPFGNWEIEIPHLTGIYAADLGWVVDSPTPTNRCSVPADNVATARPPVAAVTSNYLFMPSEYWRGIQLKVPGQGTRELLVYKSSYATTANYGQVHWVTKDHWVLTCLPNLANGGAGEGFLAISPDGTRYRFDWMASNPVKGLSKTYTRTDFQGTSNVDIGISRREYVLLATRVEDRHGNWVNYAYSGSQLTGITANDGRVINLTYSQAGNVQSVSDGQRTWVYQYTDGNLSTVILPDASQWTYTYSAPIPPELSSPAESAPACLTPLYGTNPYSITATHPSGAQATFAFDTTFHSKSYVPFECVEDDPTHLSKPTLVRPLVFATLGLLSKSISGPGLSTQTWGYEYWSGQASYATCPEGECGTTNYTDVTQPDGVRIRHTFGTRFEVNDGQLLSIETFAGASSVRTDSNSYVSTAEAASHPFPEQVGLSPLLRPDHMASEWLRPLKQTVVSQQGATFTRTINSFDRFANPLGMTRSSTLGFSRTETTTYHHDTALWVLGQVAIVTDGATGKKIRETTYNSNALPISFKSFGLLKQTLTYNADGTVASVGDGNNRFTTVGGWKRGIPFSITFADGSRRSATVDDLGLIRSTTDELNTTTSYNYDAMGRLASLSLPGWTPTSFSFVQESVNAEFGIPKNHWRHTETTGSYKKTTYFDGRFRPLLTLEEDTASATSKRFTRRAFDHENRETFASYPEASATTVTSLSQGTSTSYDALGRVTSTSQNSELGTLTTTTAYLSGFQTRTTNPRGQATTVSYQAYDSPDTSAPISILGPDNVTTAIARDLSFAKPLSVSRSGLYAGNTVGATRRYFYDGFERLCKRVDPEAGGTLFEYDGVGNLIGSAEGQSSSLGCNAIPAAARISRSYDARNRLLSVAAPNAPVTQYGYAADGALTTLVQGESAWSYNYNNRRQLISETLSFGDSYSFSYGYTPLGHLASTSTPSGLTIDYAPNALGQPSKAGSFASNAKYFPDGSLQSFSYGNGVAHTVTQNGRHLPLRVRDAGAQVVHDFTYTYDPNGNVTGIADADQAGLQSKSLLYDARDRLVSATANGLWGVASYAYDPLDNLRSADLGGRQYRYQYDGNSRLTQLTDPAGTPLTGLDFAYDAQGRQVRKGSQTRTFDGANRITAINGETYAYDGNGRRIATWAADGRTKVEVYTQNGQLGFAVDSQKGGGSSFVYLAGQRIAEDHWHCGSNTHTVSYYHSDALGSPVATTDATGNVLERTYYAPYGEALNRTVDGPGYTGHVMDAATGLVYAQQRYYDPLVGKFLSIDPVAANPGSGGNFNRYWYANNNPYTFNDPDGEFANFVAKAAVDFGLEVAIQFATTGEVDLGAAAVETAKGLVNPLKTLERAKDLRRAINVTRNARDGARREAKVTARLRSQNPNAKVQTQRALRTEDGKLAKDPVTGKGRVVDQAVIKDGRASTVETTSQTANKTEQLRREDRILEDGGTFIRDKETRELVPVNGRSELIREK